ncbi:hypothetical protein T261_03432 [Streptomyces lydicus]|nr:hypothetical protein T261_03432 [Streptomyces lydicus]
MVLVSDLADMAPPRRRNAVATPAARRGIRTGRLLENKPAPDH